MHPGLSLEGVEGVCQGNRELLKYWGPRHQESGSGAKACTNKMGGAHLFDKWTVQRTEISKKKNSSPHVEPRKRSNGLLLVLEANKERYLRYLPWSWTIRRSLRESKDSSRIALLGGSGRVFFVVRVISIWKRHYFS